MLLLSSRAAALLAVTALSACLRDAEDPARLWTGQTAQTTATVQMAGRVHTVAAHAALPASSARR